MAELQKPKQNTDTDKILSEADKSVENGTETPNQTATTDQRIARLENAVMTLANALENSQRNQLVPQIHQAEQKQTNAGLDLNNPIIATLLSKILGGAEKTETNLVVEFAGRYLDIMENIWTSTVKSKSIRVIKHG